MGPVTQAFAPVGAAAVEFEVLGEPAVWVAGYCNDVMGYIPSRRLLREGGYEPCSSMIFSEVHPGPWAPSLEERIIAKIHELNDGLRPRPTANK